MSTMDLHWHTMVTVEAYEPRSIGGLLNRRNQSVHAILRVLMANEISARNSLDQNSARAGVM
jgi:hypothetical protein